MSKNIKEILRFMSKYFMNNIHDKNISEVKLVNVYKDYCTKKAFGFESPIILFVRWKTACTSFYFYSAICN